MVLSCACVSGLNDPDLNLSGGQAEWKFETRANTGGGARQPSTPAQQSGSRPHAHKLVYDRAGNGWMETDPRLHGFVFHDLAPLASSLASEQLRYLESLYLLLAAGVTAGYSRLLVCFLQ